MDFFEKGYAIVELFDPKFASDLWNDVDKEEIYRLLDNVSDKPWKSLTFPRTESFGQFVMETDRVRNSPLLRSVKY